MRNATTAGTIPIKNWRSLTLVALIVAAAGWILFQATFGFGSTSDGVEFSPQSFTSREFHANSWLGRTVVQPAKIVCSVDISKHLSNQVGNTGQRWDLAEYRSWWKGNVKSEASILVDSFDLRNHDQDLLWEKWSRDNPGLAKILWPSVQQLAIHQCYFALPELLRFSASGPSVEELQLAIDRVCQKAGIEQAARFIEKNRLSEAKTVLDWAKNFGLSPELKLLEAKLQHGT